jgi:hypothetical protein
MSQLEKESLEAHVDLCGERYKSLENKLDNMSNRMDRFEAMLMEVRDVMNKIRYDRDKQLISWGVAIIGALIAALAGLAFYTFTV